MNSSLLLRFTRLAAATATKRAAVAPMAVRAMLSAAPASVQDEKKKRATNSGVPPEDYYDGHLMADHLEFLDDMIEKTTQLEQSVDSLKATHKEFVQNVKWMDGQDIDDLLEPTRQQKEAIAKQLAQLRKFVEDAKKTYAVDAPDGESDWHVKEEMAEIKHIIEDAAVMEDTEEILRQRNADKKVFAVDAPDGSSDARVKEELAEIRHIIDDAAVLEDTEKIKYAQMMDAKVRKDRARDPEHDW